MLEEKYLLQVGNQFFSIPDELIDEIRSGEREMIVDFLRSEEWKFELAEDCADAIEEFGHYEDDEVH